MSFKNKYQNDVQNITTTNVTFNDIKDKVIMNKKTSNKTNKILWPSLFGGLALAGAAVALVVVATGNNSTSLLPNDNKLSMKAVAKSATPIVSAAFTDEAHQQGLKRMLNTTLSLNEQTDDQIILELLGQFDTIIENDNNYTVQAVESDNPEYKYKEIITFKDLLNETNVYSLYYKDAIVEEEIEDDEVEKETTYVGIAVKDEETFKFRLELEEEYEEDETEVESTFYLYQSDDYRTYTKVTSKSEIEGLESETEYSYELYKNGSLITSYEMEVEHDPEENEVELKIELNEKEYSVTRVIEGGVTYFHVELENEATDEEVEYVYKKVIEGETVSYQKVA